MPHQGQDLLAQRRDERLPRPSLGDRACESPLEVLVLVEDEGFLGGEVREERGDGHVRLRSDVPDTDGLVPPLGEQPQRGFGDVLPGRGLLALAASEGLRHTETLSVMKTYPIRNTNG